MASNMYKVLDVVVPGQKNHGGRFWRTVAAGGVEIIGIAGSTVIVTTGIFFREPNSSFISAPEGVALGVSALVAIGAGQARRGILHH